MKKKITKFEDMNVWQESQNYAVSIYLITKTFPKDEHYGLVSQMRRAASSISANVAEGFGRKSKLDTAHFYRIAYGSLLETKNFIYLGRKLNYIGPEEEMQLVLASENLQNQINAILRWFKNNG